MPKATDRISTASADEVARFTALAEAWWDPEGEFRPLHQLNPPRISFIRDQVALHFGRDPLGDAPLTGLRILDVGCGGGLLSEPMARLGARVTAIDAGEENIRIARLHAEREDLDIEYRHQLPEELAIMDETYDVVLSMEVVEHVADLDAFLAACAALMRPGGAMALSTLNRTVKALALAKVGAEYVLRWLPPGTHDWRKFVKPSELAAGLRPHGVDLTALAGVVYSPFRDEWRLDPKDLDVNYMAFAIKAG